MNAWVPLFFLCCLGWDAVVLAVLPRGLIGCPRGGWNGCEIAAEPLGESFRVNTRCVSLYGPDFGYRTVPYLCLSCVCADE